MTFKDFRPAPYAEPARGDSKAVTLSGAPKVRSRKVSTWRNIHPYDPHGITLKQPTGPLDKLGVTECLVKQNAARLAAESAADKKIGRPA